MTKGPQKNSDVKCPVCRKETAWRDNSFRPFCSERCRLIDLGTWAAEGYRIDGDQRLPEGGDLDKKK
jgi:endogenous inhibitor of DNA gyrase (YacG/DUF329 family)